MTLRGRAWRELVEWLARPGGRRPRRRRHQRAGRARPDPVGARDGPARARRSGDHHRLDQRGALARAVPAAPSSPTPATRRLDVVVVDNGSTDGTRELVETQFPAARVVDVREPRLRAREQPRRDDLRRALRALPQPRHRDRRGHLRRARRRARRAARRSAWPASGSSPATGRCGRRSGYFPSVTRALGRRAGVGAAGRSRPRWAGERELDLPLYDREVECDWTSGSFMLARREALLERRAAWTSGSSSTPRSPTSACASSAPAGTSATCRTMTIVHHAGKGGVRPKMVAQDAYTRRQYAAEALLAAARQGLSRRGARPPRDPGRPDPARRRGRRPEAGRGAPGDARRWSAAREPPFGAPPSTAIPPG